MKPIYLSVWCLAIVSASPQNREAATDVVKNGVVFVNAHSSTRGIEFDSPIEINWRSLAPRRYENPSKSELATFEKQKDMFGNTDKEYIVATVAELAHRRFYFFSSDGVVELKVERMKGVVRFEFDNPGQGRVDYGNLIGEARRGTLPQGGGFVAVISVVEKFEKSGVDMGLSDLSDALRKEATGDKKSARPELWTVIKAIRVRRVSSGESYYFVQLVPDSGCEELCCESRYSLTTTAHPLKFIATNEYDCDI